MYKTQRSNSVPVKSKLVCSYHHHHHVNICWPYQYYYTVPPVSLIFCIDMVEDFDLVISVGLKGLYDIPMWHVVTWERCEGERGERWNMWWPGWSLSGTLRTWQTIENIRVRWQQTLTSISGPVVRFRVCTNLLLDDGPLLGFVLTDWPK